MRLALVTTAISACGGGGSSGGAGSGGTSSGGTPPPPPPQSPNSAPVLVHAVPLIPAIENHPMHFDASQGGTTFSDPDGDQLTYSVLNNGRETAGPWIDYTPPVLSGRIDTGIVARDGRGGETTHWFLVDVAKNAWPEAVRPNSVLFATPGQHVNRDLTQGGATFQDANGDPLTYTVEMTSPPGRGFAVTGTNAVGSPSTVSVATFKITASDGYGGTGVDTFVVVVPGPEPGKPTLPAREYAYQDDELALPYDFRRSALILAPFWDTARTSGNHTTDAGATLGRVLFYDKRLSLTNTHACGSCHQQAHGFTITDAFPVGVQGVPLTRSAMPLANSRYNLNEMYFSDGRVHGLEVLALMPIENPMELGNSLPTLVDRLEATDFYPPLFAAAFGSPEITPERIATALAQFLRSILSYRTRFDQAYSRMDDPEIQPPQPPPDPTQFLTATEIRGVELFHASGCDGCHDTTAQLMGSQFNNGLDPTLDPATGNGGFFRAASLRNIALTAPYMHDGRFATLRQVIEHYDHSVIETPNLSNELREFNGGPVRRLHLTEQDKDALEAFFHTLTDDALLADPKFADPF